MMFSIYGKNQQKGEDDHVLKLKIRLRKGNWTLYRVLDLVG